jgi:hypothetical protein
MSKNILFAIPSIDGKIPCQHVISFLTLVPLLQKEEISFDIQYEMFNSNICSARNKLISKFLKGNFTDLLFIDSDIVFNSTNIINFLKSNEPVIAGAYRMKTAEVLFSLQNLKNINKERTLGEVNRIGAGFLKLTKECLEKMILNYPEYKLKGVNDYAFFDTSIKDGYLISEDYTFCDRWRKLGGNIKVDLTVKLTHIGVQNYKGDLLSYLKL